MDHGRWKKLTKVGMMIRMVGGWVCVLVLAHLCSPGQSAVKRLW